MRSVLFVGAGRHQRRAIQRARELGLRVVGVDRNADALGLREADVAETVDFQDVEGVIAAAERHHVDGVLTISADRAVPIVAAVAEALGLPGIGTATAERMTHKALMRKAFAEAGVPQPPWAAVETLEAARAALPEVGLPAVLKPADSGGQRGVVLLEAPADLEREWDATIRESATGVAIIERFRPGMELNGLVIAREGRAEPLTLSDRRRPPGVGFGVGWMHVYPPTIPAEQYAEAELIAARAVEALGLRDGIGFPQLIATDEGTVELVECAARIPGGQMADLARHATGVDLIDVQLRFALGDPIPDELVRPQVRQPLAIRFFTAEPGPLPTGRVVRLGSLEPVLAAPGVVQADSYIVEGETIRPVRLDGDRRGYVIATGATNLEALERAEAAARLYRPEVELSDADRFDLGTYVELLQAAQTGGYRFAGFDRDPEAGDVILRHDVDLSLEAALAMAELERAYGARSTYFLMTESVFYNLASPLGVEAIARLRDLGHGVGLHGVWPRAVLDERFDPVVAWHNPDPEYMRQPLLDGTPNVMEERFARHYRSDSNQHWRQGSPREDLAAGRFEWLQLLTHPEIWFFEGATMGETMRRMLEDERETRLGYLRHDRIDLD